MGLIIFMLGVSTCLRLDLWEIELDFPLNIFNTFLILADIKAAFMGMFGELHYCHSVEMRNHQMMGITGKIFGCRDNQEELVDVDKQLHLLPCTILS